MAVNRRAFLDKLGQIEQSAEYALREMPPGLGAEHLRLVISLAKYLATELELTR